jgi:iron(II)-dependent oxidoreductase
MSELVSPEQRRRLPTAAEFHALADQDFWARIGDLRSELDSLQSNAERRDALGAFGGHGIWQVRACLLDMSWEWRTMPEAVQYILDCTHDPVDAVAFQAIRYTATLRSKQAVPHLVKISGWPSLFSREDHLRKPVGIGAALTKNALATIFGSEQPDELRRLEDDFLEPYRQILRAGRRQADLAGMVLVEKGEFTFGATDVSDFRFFYKDFIPAQQRGLPSYYIDKYPVTNADYQVFLKDLKRTGKPCGHPDDVPDKDRTPSHWRDGRFTRDDLPVTGIDWYDAWAYANWAGKKLPTEEQWEKAARGSSGAIYPWGDTWDPCTAQYAESSFGTVIGDIKTWEQVLRSYSDVHPAMPVIGVADPRQNVSPVGATGMAGNVWEWTRTNFFSKKDMDPFFKRRHPVEFMNRPAAFAVIRGGCFTSLPEMLRGYYRGKDLITDRHCEIGFRCVVEMT